MKAKDNHDTTSAAKTVHMMTKDTAKVYGKRKRKPNS